MGKLDAVHAWLDDNLGALAAEHQVPGAAIGVLAGAEIADAATGVLNLATNVEATVDSVFQVGSITKIWTTTLVMQLVDEGAVDLDKPLRTYVPEFRVADETATEAITVRRLLSHTAGFEGDIFAETNRGDDAVERYVPLLEDLPQEFAPGRLFSYNNAGFALLGRLVEVFRGKPYNDVLRERLATPLGLTHVATRADEAILYRAAVGHVRPDPEGGWQPAPVWALPYSLAPAGAMLAMSPRSLLGFARMHLSGGLAQDGTRLLSESAVRAMQERQVDVPRLSRYAESWGLGWALPDWPGGPVVGHDGGTIGQSAFLRLVPDKGVAVALLTNGGETPAFYARIFTHLLAELAGVEVPEFSTPPADPEQVDPARYIGRYEVRVARLDVEVDAAGKLWLTSTPKGDVAEAAGARPERHELLRLDGDTFITADKDQGVHATFAFVGDDGNGKAAFLHTGRAIPRVG